MKHPIQLILVALLLAALPRAASADEFTWWNTAWKYRQRIEITTPDTRGAINTAHADIDTQGLCAEDGRDLRILDQRGQAVPYKVVEVADGVARVQFEVVTGVLIYYAYYGNSDAPAETHTWEAKLGGLTLKTMENTAKNFAWNHDQMMQLIQSSTKVFGEGPRRNIDDGSNLFGKTAEDQEHYLSIYTGKLFCPATGYYTLATNSDDSSFLFIDDRLTCQQRGGSAPKDTWKEAPSGRRYLVKGVHDITYYHVQNGGGMLARAGWQPPGAAEITTIPPQYFLRELRTQIVSREALEKSVNAFFTTDEGHSVTFNRSARRFTPLTFADRSIASHGAVKHWEWDFGDGSPLSIEQNPTHVYTRADTFTITLTCYDEYGLVDTCKRRIAVGETAAERIALFMDIDTDSPVLGANEEIVFRARFMALSNEAVPLRFQVEARDSDGHSTFWHNAPVVLNEKKYARRKDTSEWIEQRVALGFAMPRGDISLKLFYHGKPVQQHTVRVLPAAGSYGTLTLARRGLRDGEGRHVLMRLSDKTSGAVRAVERLSAGETLRVVVVDDLLSPAEATEDAPTYHSLALDQIRKRFPRGKVQVTRLDGSIFEQYPPLERLGKVPAMVVKAKADLVILAPGVNDMLQFLPEQTYERYLWALCLRIMGAAPDTDIVLITPPPMMTQSRLSHRYAYATKRVATRLGLPVADAYSAFLMRPTPWEELYRDTEIGDEVYYVWPTREGQRLIADRLTDALTGERPSDDFE